MSDFYDLPPLGPSLPDGSSIAVIGSGIAGSSVAHFLCKTGRYKVTLFEKSKEFGGAHRHVLVDDTPIDIGVVYVNPYDYVNVFALYTYLGVKTRSFLNGLTVSIGVDESGNSLVFSSPNGYGRPWSVVPDIDGFSREISALDEYLKDPLGTIPKEYWAGSLGDWMTAVGFSEDLQGLMRLVLDPMMLTLDTPLGIIAPFYTRLQFTNTSFWWLPTIGGGDVIARLLENVHDKRHSAEVTRIDRDGKGVTLTVKSVNGEEPAEKQMSFDYVVSAVTMNIAARLFEAPTDQESAIFAKFPDKDYINFNTWVHEDSSAGCFPDEVPRYQYTTAVMPYGAPGPTSSVVPNFDNGDPAKLPTPFVTDCMTEIPFDAKGPVHDLHAWQYIDRTADIYNLRPTFNRMQGTNRTFWCGVDTTDMSAEAALTSGLAVLHSMGVEPHEVFLNRQALARRYLYTGWADGDRDDPAWWQKVCRLY